jgi:ABC-type cobalt transport system substrate-binding protein
MKQLSQFPKSPSTRYPYASGNYVSVSRKSPCFSANQFNQARKSDWAKCQIMDGLSTLSQQLAKTAGTAFSQNSAGQLNQYATQLKQSDDPQFQQIGMLYTQEAQALQTGNIQGADQAANQVSAVPKPYVAPGYQPTQGESQLVSAFNSVIGTVIAGLGGILGTFAVSQILQALGIPNLASLLGTGQVAGTSLATGQNPSVVANNAGANVIYQGGSSAMQQLGTINVNPRQSQNSANAGGAPSAQ